jgi:hypothetical protein
MKAAAETTLAIAADPKRLGARIGITAVLHAWGSHPHVHMIVPGGGISLDSARWVAFRSNFPHTCQCAGAMLAMLMHAHGAGQLKFLNAHAGLADRKAFKRVIAPLRHIKWVVYCKAPIAGPEQVLRYLSRYTHRVAISNRFSWQPTTPAPRSAGKTIASMARGRSKTMRLHPHEFIRRFLLHVLPKGSIASATTDSLLPPTAPTASPRPAHYSMSPRRPATAAGCRAGRTTCAAMPMPALWRSHDRYRGIRARVAANAELHRHVMTQTRCEHRDFPVPLRWLHASSNLSRPNRSHQCTDRPLIPSQRLPKIALHSPDCPSRQTCRWRRASVTPTIEGGANIKSP